MFMEKKEIKIEFSHFLEMFPEVDLPITLTEEMSSVFSKNNDPLPLLMCEQFLGLDQADSDAAYMEYVPCFKIPQTYAFHAIVFWKASLLTYEYYLRTYTEKGELIDQRVIAGTKLDNELLVGMVATIEDDWLINVVIGATDKTATNFDPASNQFLHLELLPDGKIINIKN